MPGTWLGMTQGRVCVVADKRNNSSCATAYIMPKMRPQASEAQPTFHFCKDFTVNISSFLNPSDHLIIHKTIQKNMTCILPGTGVEGVPAAADGGREASSPSSKNFLGFISLPLRLTWGSNDSPDCCKTDNVNLLSGRIKNYIPNPFLYYHPYQIITRKEIIVLNFHLVLVFV